MNKFIRITCCFLLLVIGAVSPDLAAQESYSIYFGNLHAHTGFSDGCQDSAASGVRTPAQAYHYAKESKHLDFLGISEHNHKQAGMKNKDNYALGLSQAKSATVDGHFVALYGMEYGVIKDGGHVLIYGMDGLIGWEDGNFDYYNPTRDYQSLFTQVASTPGAFATLAHPNPADFGRLKSMSYTLKADQAICGVAITTGQHKSQLTDYSSRRPLSFFTYYTGMLAKGYILGPTMDHDNHYTTFGRHTASRTAVLAKSLTASAIIEAYRANRFYASQDWNAQVSFSINDQLMGGYVKGDQKLIIEASVIDYDPMDEVRSIELLYGIPGSGKFPKLLAKVTTDKLQYSLDLKDGEAFYFLLRITQLDGDIIVSSPIWAKR